MRRCIFLTGIVLATLAMQTAVGKTKTKTKTANTNTSTPQANTNTTTPSIVNPTNTATNTTTSSSISKANANTPRFDAETMRVALRTTGVEENGFIDRVLGKVRKGILPSDLVDSTFQWARRKTRHRFQYFKYGLIIRANAMGVKL
jgi:hypothetical protein